MNQKQIQLVRSSWKIFQKIDQKLVGEIFYGKLFADHPQLRKMFPSSMDAQSRKLLDMFSTIVARLDQTEQLAAQLAAMGRRHEGYGVKRSHYSLVGKAFLWTLRTGFGKDWNDELQEAWETCYAEISDQMCAHSGQKFIQSQSH